MTTVLLTGASGFLGRYLAEGLAKQFEVIQLGRRSGDITCDLAAGVPDLQRADMVVHAAAQPPLMHNTPQAEELFFRNNCQATRNLLAGLANSALPQSLVFMSSVHVYGRSIGTLLGESEPLVGDNPYAKSKIECEDMIRQWGSEHNVSTTILRLPLIVAMDARGNLERMIRAIRKGRYIRIGDGSAKRTMVHALDIAEFVPKLMGRQGTFNLADGYHPTVRELEDTLATRLESRIRFNISTFAARWMGKIGDLSFGLAPFNSELFQKICGELTFSDELARRELAWNPRNVLDRLLSTSE